MSGSSKTSSDFDAHRGNDGAKCPVVTMSSKTNTGSYDALVNNGIAKLGSEETWRHMVSVVFRHSDLHTYRLVIKKLLFGERCLNCVMTNKSRGFCFFKVVDKDDRLNSTTEESLYKWVANEYCAREGCSATATDEPISLTDVGNALTIFPEPEVLKVTKGNKRIPESHTLPSVSEFFLTDDESFVSFLRVSMFESLCCEKQTISICFQAASSTWTEPTDTFRTRVSAFKQLEHLPWEKGRMLLKDLVDLQWKQWKDPNCHKGGKECKVGGCAYCKLIRCELSKRFRTLVRKGFEDRLQRMLVEREGYCKNVPQHLDTYYANAEVIINRLDFPKKSVPSKREAPTVSKPLKVKVPKKSKKSPNSVSSPTLVTPENLKKVKPTDKRFLCDNVTVEEI